MAKKPHGGSHSGNSGGGHSHGGDGGDGGSSKRPHGEDGGDGSSPRRHKVTAASNITEAQSSVEASAQAGRSGGSNGSSSRGRDSGGTKDTSGTNGNNGGNDTNGNGGNDSGSTPHRSGGDSDAADARNRARQDPDATSEEPGCQGSTPDPVDLVSGDVFLTHTDVSLPGTLPLVLTRTHLSSYRLGRAFGRTWASTLDTRLEVEADGGALLIGPDGVILVYRQVPLAGVVFPEAGRRLGLSPATGGGFTATDSASGVTWHFVPETNGRPGPLGGPQVLPLAAVTHRCGDRIDLTRADGVVREVVHSGGYRVTVDWDNNRIARYRLTGADGRPQTLVRFGYPDGELVGEIINSSGLPLRLEYDDTGRLIRWTDRNQRWYGYTYDEQGRCVYSTGDGGYHTTRLAYDEANRTTTVTDALGHATTHTHDEHKKIVRVVDPLGGVTLRSWNRAGNLLAETDPSGATTRYDYDERGNLVRTVAPDGAQTTATYTPDGLPASVTGPDGTTWTRTFDARGNLLTLTDPTGAVTTCTWDAAGHIASLTDAMGATTTYTCDGAGLPRTVSDPSGATARYERDAAGRVVAVIDRNGSITTTRYTPDGLLDSRTDPTGATETWSWDPEGNLLEHTSPAGATTRFEYTQFDEPVARIDPDGARLTFAYNARMQVSTVTNPQGLTWAYQYDPVGRLVAETDFNGRTLHYLLDPAGRVIGKLNGLGAEVQLARDPAGRVVTRTAPEGQTHYSYDPAGRLLRAVSATSDLSYTYDPLGRVVAETVDGRTTTNTYDPIGRRTSRTTPTGIVSTWTHAGAGAPTTLTTAGHTIGFEHDAVGNLLEQILIAPTGALSLRQTHDPMGRLATQTLLALSMPADPAGASRDGAAAGADPVRMVAHREYTYRADGLLTRVADTHQGTRDLTLDEAGRITEVNAAAWTERYAYDRAGNITQAVWSAGGAAGTSAATEASGDREYRGTLIRRAGRVRFEHDAQGRVVLRQVARHSAKPDTWRYVWDSDDRLTTVVCPDGDRWLYLYDPNGRRTAKHRYAPDGRVLEQIIFAWDGPRLIEQVHYRHDGGDTGPTVTSWEYEPGTHTPIAQHRRHWLSTAAQPVVDERFHTIVTDLLGTPTHLVSPDGGVDWHTVTTIWGTTTQVARADGVDCPLRFPGQYHDRETGHHYNHHRYYDPDIGGYLSQDPLGLTAGPRPTAYVSNPLAWTDPLGLKCDDQSNHPGIQERRAHTETVVDGRRVIYDSRGVPHVIGEAPTSMEISKVRERQAFDALNDQLRANGEIYDPRTGNGSEFLWQDDVHAIVPKGKMTVEGTTAVTGTTSDFVKVTRQGGQIVSVESYDVNSSESPVNNKNMDFIKSTVDNKMDINKKGQTDNVVFVAASPEQAAAARNIFAGDPRVQVIEPGP